MREEAGDREGQGEAERGRGRAGEREIKGRHAEITTVLAVFWAVFLFFFLKQTDWPLSQFFGLVRYVPCTAGTLKEVEQRSAGVCAS